MRLGIVWRDVAADIKKARKLQIPWYVVPIIWVGGLPILILLDRAGRFDLAMPILFSILAFAVVVAFKWSFRKHVWFWATIAVLGGLHVPLIMLIHWSMQWVPYFTVAAAMTLDFFFMLAIVDLVTRVVGAQPDKRRNVVERRP